MTTTEIARAIPVQLAVNDNNGNCSGHIQAIDFGWDCPLKLSAFNWDDNVGDFVGPRFGYHFRTYPDWSRRPWNPMPCRGDIQIERRRFPFVGFKPHFGNIIWDVVMMPERQALRLLKWIRRHQLFDLEEGPMPLYGIFDMGRGEIKPAHLRATL